MSLTGDLKYGSARSRSAAPSAATDLPITLKGNHSAVLHDTGTGFSVLPNQMAPEATDWMLPVVETCEFIAQRRNKFAHLKRSLLVRVNLRRKGESVEILCGSQEMGRNGMMLSMPCTLDFAVGMTCDMELFLTQDREPLPVHGTVRRISRTLGVDAIRYKIEVEFAKLGHLAESELAAFVDAAQPEELRPILV